MPLGVGGNERQLAPHMGPGKHTGAPPLGRAHLQGSPGTLPPPPPPPDPAPAEPWVGGKHQEPAEPLLGGTGHGLTATVKS